MKSRDKYAKQKRYAKSIRGRAVLAKYWASPAGKAARRRATVKYEYGLSGEKYVQLKRLHRNRCAVCRRPPRHKSQKELHVDHDHRTGAVRGLLCLTCNTGIGKLGDNARLLRRAAEYLDAGGFFW